MRLPVLMILCGTALLPAPMLPAAHAQPVCETVGWTDPVTGPHPDDGPCIGDAPKKLCEPFDTEYPSPQAPDVAVSVAVCVPDPGRE
jgi:hypothetical protein